MSEEIEVVSVDSSLNSQNQEQDDQVDEVPEDVRNLQKTLEDLNIYKNIVERGQFLGKDSMYVENLKKFIKDLYAQVYKQYTEHEFYRSYMEAHADEA